jgi:isoquinoline 1-oxidoreductase beta subunit
MSSREPTITVDPYLPEFLQKLQAEAAAAKSLSLDRRSFIKVTGLAGGGLMLGFTLGVPNRRASAQAADETFVPNAYVQVRADGTVVLSAKNPEVGQGVKTSMPMILAEEMDADWASVEVEQSEIDVLRYGPQFAGGSTSIPMNWVTLRRAGAVARAMLVAAAAEQFGVPAGELATEAGFVVHRASNRRSGYGVLAARAAQMPVPDPETVPLKSRAEFKLLGKRITGVDNVKIVTGQPLFGIDQMVPGMLYAAYAKGPAIGARAVSANLDHIKSLPGVRDAFILESSGDPIEFGPDAPAVLSGVAIVANSTWAAFQAKRQLQVTWDESGASSDSWSTAAAEAARLAATDGATTLADNGDDAGAFAQASTTAEGFYTYQYASHADLEPQNCTAWFKGDSIEIWAPTQTPQAAVDGVAALLGLPKEKVTLHQLRGGGGFGRRLANDSVCEVAAISKHIGAPVKAQWMREDDMTFDYYRPGGFHSFKAAIDGNGKLSAWQDHFITFTRNGAEPVSAANLSPQEFPANVLPNARLTQTMLSSKIPTGPWRAPGSNAIAFAVQSFLHECAVAANRDHLEFLLEVIGEPRWLEPGNTRALNTERAAAVIKLAAEKAGWGRALPRGRGLGLAFHFSHAGHFAEVADVSVDSNRKLTVHSVTVAGDIGPIVNLSGAENQCQGSVIDGLSTMMGLEITFENGRVEQRNFDRYPILRITQAPRVDVHFIDSSYDPTGCGEPAFPPAAPAIANAIYAATGHRVRTLPLTKEGFTV